MKLAQNENVVQAWEYATGRKKSECGLTVTNRRLISVTKADRS